MELLDRLDEEIEKLKNNQYNLIITKTKNKGIITTSIIIPKEIINKEISEISIEFQLIIDTNSLKISPKLYCVSPFCYPHFADGRDLFNELRSTKNLQQNNWLPNLLTDILEFIKINFDNGGLNFCGNYYLGSKYDLRILQKGCENILNVKENLVLNGKSIKLNRVLVVSDIYFLLFDQEKWYKNNLTLLFWSSISNIEKIQKVKDSKTLILQWIQKEKETYPMSLTIQQREVFIKLLLEKMNHFGMVYDVKVLEGGKNQITKRLGKNEGIIRSQNIKLINDYNRQEEEKENNNNKDEEGEGDEDDEEYEEYEEGEEEEDDEEENEKNENKENNNNEENKQNIEEKKVDDVENKENNNDINNKNEEINKDININININNKEGEEKVE